MKKEILCIAIFALLMSMACQVSAQTTPRYKIHRTASTKTIVLDGGAETKWYFSEGLACVSWKNGWFVINNRGEKVFDIPKGYRPKGTKETLDGDFDICFNSGRLMVYSSSNKRALILDAQGKTVKALSDVRQASGFQDGVAIIKKEEKIPGKYGTQTVWYHLDINGNTLSRTMPISSTTFIDYRLFRLRDGLAPVYDEKSRKWGFRNKNCQLVIPFAYDGFGADDGGGFYHGLSRAKDPQTGKWGFIDTKGNWAIRPIYSERPGNFYGGYSLVVDKSGCEHFINTSGKIVWTNPRPKRGDVIKEFWEAGNKAYSIWWVDGDTYIINSSFQRVKKVDIDINGRMLSVTGNWFQWRWDSDKYKVSDWNGNVILDYMGRSGSFEEGYCAINKYYINEKGEIIVIFEDTQF